MDLEKNIEIAAEVYFHNHIEDTSLPDTDAFVEMYIEGAKSQAAKDFWYNEFKQTISVGILNQINDLPTHKVPEQCPDVKYLMDGSWNKYKEYIYYNPDRPISFNNWKYMVENYKGESSNIIHKHIGIIDHVDYEPQIFGLYTRNVGKSLMASVEQIPFEMGGLGQEHHKGVIAIVPDQAAMDYASEITCMIAADSSIKNIIVITKEHYEAQGKDSILKSRAIGITEMPPIKSIVPIADVIPEEIISKQEFLEMHDKAVERSITEETYKESHAWDIKKEKKVSHKRNNKRK